MEQKKLNYTLIIPPMYKPANIQLFSLTKDDFLLSWDIFIQ